MGVVLARHRQMAEGASQLQVTAARDRNCQVDRKLRLGTLASHAAVDLELDRCAPA